jgi:hypothetical protein
VKIVDVEGIGPGNTSKLEGAGVATTEELPSTGGTARGREALAAATGISPKLRWSGSSTPT